MHLDHVSISYRNIELKQKYRYFRYWKILSIFDIVSICTRARQCTHPCVTTITCRTIISTEGKSVTIVNFCSVTNKQAELEDFLVTHNLHSLLGTESHLDVSANV